MLNHGVHSGGGPELQTAAAVMGLVFYSGLGAIFLVIGVGSVRLRNWARIAAQIVSGCWLATGVISGVFLIVMLPNMMQQQARPLPPGQLRAMYAVMGAFVLGLGILLPGVLLVFNSLPSVRATFLLRGAEPGAAGMQTAPAAQTPVPVMLLGAWECLGVAAVLSMLMIPATILFGFVVRGLGAILVMSAFSFLSGVAAWLIFRRDPMGWVISLGKVVFFGTSWMVTLLTRDLMEVYRQIGLSEEQIRLLQVSAFRPMIAVFSCVGLVIPATLLFISKKHFSSKDGGAN